LLPTTSARACAMANSYGRKVKVGAVGCGVVATAYYLPYLAKMDTVELVMEHRSATIPTGRTRFTPKTAVASCSTFPTGRSRSSVCLARVRASWLRLATSRPSTVPVGAYPLPVGCATSLSCPRPTRAVVRRKPRRLNRCGKLTNDRGRCDQRQATNRHKQTGQSLPTAW
jgi:hypothetical protein